MSWSKTYTFSPSTTIASAEINKNFDDCINAVNAAMPSGLIVIWSGSIASIPSGFYLCNGSNSTPDLRDKFVVGAGSTYAVNATGGEATHTLTTDEIPDNGAQQWYGARQAENTTTTLTDATKYVGFKDAIYGGGAHNNLPPYLALAYIMKS